jgi:hypothetical protein
MTLLAPWMIWKQHRECTFNHASPCIPLLLASIKESKFWAQAGALGLRML